MKQLPLEQMMADRLGVALSGSEGQFIELIVDARYAVVLEFSREDVVFLAKLISLPVNAEQQVALLRQVAGVRFKLARVCQEQIYFDVKDNGLMVRRILKRVQASLPVLETQLQNFLNTLQYFKEMLAPYEAGS